MEELQLESIIKEYSDEVLAIAKKYYISDGSIEDLYQEGLIGLASGFKTYDTSHGAIGSPAFKAFLLMCAKRQIIDAVKKSNSKRNLPMSNFVSLSSEDFVETTNMAQPTVVPLEDRVLTKISNEEDEITLNLSEFEKTVLNYYLDGLKQSEIATIVNKPVKSIDNCLQRIKTKLKGRNKWVI